jgi:hypothetical protein
VRRDPEVICPVCVAPVAPAYAVWSRRVARCLVCGTAMAIDGEIIPLGGAVPAYPQRLLAHRVPAAPRGTPFRFARAGGELRVRYGGWLSLVSKTITIAPDRFEERTRLGGRSLLPLAKVAGFLPVQYADWAAGRERPFIGARVRLLTTDPVLYTIFEAGRWEHAAHLASTLNEAVEEARLRSAPSPYRG